MIVIPMDARTLSIRIDILFCLLHPHMERTAQAGWRHKLKHLPIGEARLKWRRIFRQKEIHWMPIAFRRGNASMQMRRDRDGQVIDLAYDDLASTSRLDGWSREDAIVAPDGSGKTRENMSSPRFLCDLVVVSVCIAANRRKDRRNGKRNAKGLYGRAAH